MKRLIALLLMVCIGLLAACSGPAAGSSNPNSGTSLNLNDEAQKQAERTSQTLWSVLNKEGSEINMLPDDNENVKAIVRVVEAHCAVVSNRDYTRLDTEAELRFYSADFVELLNRGGYSESLKKLYEENLLQLTNSHSQIIWYRSYFNEDLTTCKVTVDGEFEVAGAAQSYLDKMAMEKGMTYQEPRIYYFEKKDGEWQITNITKGVLTKKATI